MQPIIRVHNLSKRYRIGRVERYHTLRESIVRSVTVPVRLARKMFGGREGAAQEGEHQMWALNDVSFDVMPGEVLGLIGRNGAGKSTLLKVLSRITEPSAGRAEIYGRVGSLLEVGTGFHLELTGRENIYLSGAIPNPKSCLSTRCWRSAMPRSRRNAWARWATSRAPGAR
jgi:lipopolysaccharide transport system ATP-binding protein